MFNKDKRISEMEKSIELLKTVVDNQEKIIDSMSKQLYVPVQQITDVDKLNSEMAEIGEKDSFHFYLLSVETEVIDTVRACSIDKINQVSLQARGILYLIDKMRKDFTKKENVIPEKDSKHEADLILSKMDQFRSSPGVN